jgi:hypothetical protein
MFGPMYLDQVLRHQDELRREAAQDRLAARANRHQPRTTKARRVFGLRLSPA